MLFGSGVEAIPLDGSSGERRRKGTLLEGVAAEDDVGKQVDNREEEDKDKSKDDADEAYSEEDDESTTLDMKEKVTFLRTTYVRN